MTYKLKDQVEGFGLAVAIPGYVAVPVQSRLGLMISTRFGLSPLKDSAASHRCTSITTPIVTILRPARTPKGTEVRARRGHGMG
jgi:hypothetical protein